MICTEGIKVVADKEPTGEFDIGIVLIGASLLGIGIIGYMYSPIEKIKKINKYKK